MWRGGVISVLRIPSWDATPVGGTVVEVNTALANQPELVNKEAEKGDQASFISQNPARFGDLKGMNGFCSFPKAFSAAVTSTMPHQVVWCGREFWVRLEFFATLMSTTPICGLLMKENSELGITSVSSNPDHGSWG